MRKFLAAFLGLAGLCAATPAHSQWQVTSGCVPVGRGGGVTGFLSACTNPASVSILNVLGSSSGTVALRSQAAAGNWNFNLPITAGTAGQVLTSQGGGSNAMTWTTAGAGGGTVTSVGTASPITGGTITSTGTIGCATCVTSAAALTVNQIVLGSGLQATAVLGSLGTTTTVLHGNAAGAPTFGAVVLTTDVSGILPVANGGTGIASGTSGGVLAFTASGTIVSSGALTANNPVIGGGAGVAVSSGTRSGNTTIFATVTGAFVAGHCLQIDASTNIVDAGGACTTGGGGGTVSAGTAGQLTYYASSGTVVTGNANATISSGVLTLGQTGSFAGGLILSGSTTGAITIALQAAAGTYNFNLPTTAGSSGAPLLSAGGGASAMTFGTVGVAFGGTGLTSGTSGGILGFTASGTIASSIALTANAIVLGGGAGATPVVLGSLGTTATVLHGNAAGAPTFGAVVSADLNITATTCTNQFVSAISAAAAGTCTTDTLASAQHANQGTTATLLHGNAAGNPSWAAVNMASEVTGTLVVANGGTGSATLTNHGVLVGAGTSAVTQLAAAVAGTVLTGQGATSDPSFTATPTLGVSGTTLGSLGLSGNTSGVVTISVNAAAGTYTFKLPNSAGTNGQVLATDGSGNTSWTAAGGSSSLVAGTTAITSGTANRLAYQDGGNTFNVSTLAFFDNTSLVLNDTAARTFITQNGSSTATPQLQTAGTTFSTESMALAAYSASTALDSHFIFYRSVSGTVASATAVSNNTILGTISFVGAQQTGTFSNQTNAASIRAEVDGVVTSGISADMPGRIILATTPDGSGTLTDSLKIDNAGNWFMLLAGSTDVGKADNAVCRDSTTGQLYRGSGTAQACLGTSSARYKHDIRDLHVDCTKLAALKPKRFFYNKGFGDDGLKEQYGFIAEDVYEVLPELVGVDDRGRPNTVDMFALIPIFTQCQMKSAP